MFSGRIEGRFEQVLRDKLTGLDSTVSPVRLAPDAPGLIAAAIGACLADGAELVVTSGNMSVDPDDVTRLGIARTGAEDMVYGTPVLPRLLTGETIGRAELVALGHGGLCRNCARCQYPVCSFGKA